MNGKRERVGDRLTDYLPQNADRVITADGLEAELGFLRSSILNAMRRLVERFPDHLEPRGHTAWIWHSEPRKAKPAPAPDLVLLKVLKAKDDGSLLALDEGSQQVYVCRPVEF